MLQPLATARAIILITSAEILIVSRLLPLTTQLASPASGFAELPAP
jgi:hypothetical protein